MTDLSKHRARSFLFGKTSIIYDPTREFRHDRFKQTPSTVLYLTAGTLGGPRRRVPLFKKHVRISILVGLVF